MALTLPLAEAQAQLTTVNAAISDIIAGKRIVNLRVGSGSFQREYKYYNPEKLLEELRDYQKELTDIVASYTISTPTFRMNATIPLVIKKDL